MPQYFFDVQDGEGVFVDEVGMELPDMPTAVHEARRALGDMVRDALRDDEGGGIVIRIRDGVDGPVVLTVTLTTDWPEDDAQR